MRRIIALIILVVLAACVPNKTNTASFDPMAADTMPREVALDATMSFGKASAPHDEATCIFDEVGVRHEDRTEVVPYEQTEFYAQNVAYSPVDWHSHIFLQNRATGAPICDSMLAREYYGQANFDKKMKWLGTALLSLGSEYSPKE